LGLPTDERREPHGEQQRGIPPLLEALVETCTRRIDGYLFGEYLAALEGFVWGELADAYVELSKPALRNGRAEETVRTLAYVLDRVLRLVHPIMPFLSETLALQLWQRARPSDGAPSLVIARWPLAGARDPKLEERFAVVVDVVRAIRNLRADAGIDPGERVRVSL